MAMPAQASRADRLTATGIFVLRIAAGLFFLIPGLYKLVAPGDFTAMLETFPPGWQPALPFLFQIVTWAEIIGGLLVILGFNLRAAIPPFLAIILVASFFIVQFDDSSRIKVLSLFAHAMAAGLYTALFFLGSGRWSVDQDRDLVWRLSRHERGPFARAARDLVAGWSRNRGIFLLRASVAFPFLMVFIMAVGLEVTQMVMPDHPALFWPLAAIAFIGGLSVLTGFRVSELAWILIALTILHLVVVAIPDAAVSRIGLINILFHLLLIAALFALRLIRLGGDLEVEHILNTERKNIVVIGGGFAGTELVRKLERILPTDYRVVMISEENYTVFNPLLAEIVGATILPAQAIAPIRRMIRRTRFILGQVTAIDTATQTVQYRNDERTGDIRFDHLVFALGSRANLNLVPGMADHAMPFKLLGDALHLRNRVIQQMEKTDEAQTRDERHWLGHFIVIGGGFSGVEVAGAIHDFLEASHKHFPRLHDANLKVTVIHGTDCLLPELNATLGRYAGRSMAKRGIDVRLNARVTSVDERGVVLKDGTRIDGATVVSTIGTTPNPLLARTGLPLERGRLRAQGDMRVEGETAIWALGDCAMIPNAHDNGLAAPTAQFAVREGRHLADNIALAVRNRPTQPFAYQAQGSMASIGTLNGVADLGGVINITGFPAWLLWRAYYLSLMPTFLRKVQILFEWTWAMLFSADVSNLRFTTSAEVDRKDSAA